MATVRILEKLVSFRTVTGDRGESRRAFQWIEKQLNDLPLFVRHFDFGGFHSFIATTQKTKQPRLVLAAHLDVVPGTPELFRPRHAGRRLYGRGCFDMKFAIACYIQLVKELRRTLSAYDFGLMITTDEEVGGIAGTEMILKRGWGGSLCLLPDGGRDWRFERSAKGVLTLHVVSRGISHHGSRPWLGENAIEKLFDFLDVFKKQFPREPCGNPGHQHETLNIGKMKGGEATNKIPDWAEAFLDIRFTPRVGLAGIRTRIRKALGSMNGIRVEEQIAADAYRVDTKNPLHRAFLDAARKEGMRPAFLDSHGSSDARFFLKRKIPVILVRPNGGGHHSDREWIDVKNLDVFYRVLRRFVERVTRR